jgi:tRNA pseudouridine13 synthase
MKLKRQPEDFQVEEQISLVAAGGSFALYRLTKQSIGTPEAVDVVAQRWKLPPNQIAFAGLKDKHALTRQFLTIHNGPKRGMAQSNLELEYVGQVARPIHASDITGNRFEIVIRDLTDEDVQSTVKSLASIATDGIPNYFDNQRFGSLGQSGEFIAKPWCLGDYESALWLAIAESNARDRRQDREEKGILRENWNKWSACAELLPHARAKRIINHLVQRPTDFRRAIPLIRLALRSLWLAAFQSHLWNLVLNALVNEVCKPQQLTPYRIGCRDLSFFNNLNASQRDRLHNVVLPLPSARLHLDDDWLRPIYDRVLAAEGMELRQVRVKYPRDSFFSKGVRPATFHPAGLTHAAAADELNPGQKRLTLQFTLARGSYATILVKQIVGPTGNIEIDDD